jgi:hypothetical protein
MSWELSGKYVANCNCQLVCPCPVDATPTGPNGECRGAAVFHVANGNLDGTDLSGLDFAFCNWFPSNLTGGNWKVGVVLDQSVSDEQAAALERILRGEEGGAFGDLSALYGEWLGVERGDITFSDGDAPSASVAGRVDLSFTPLPGPDGKPTSVKNAMFGFAPEFLIGKGSGRSDLFGIGFEAVYGETADFNFSSEMAEGGPKGRA